MSVFEEGVGRIKWERDWLGMGLSVFEILWRWDGGGRGRKGGGLR